MKKQLCTLCLLFLLLLPLFPGCVDEPFTGLVVEVIDVGQSDCTLITLGEAALMIDTGTVTERGAVQRRLWERGIEVIDYLVLTHPHEDHIGNARMMVEAYTVGALLVPPIVTEDFNYGLVSDAAAGRNVPVKTVMAGECFALDDATVEILQTGSSTVDPNNSSIVLRVVYGETEFLFTGDNEEAGEAALVADLPAEALDCDFLKAGHHGSQNATGEALLALATPAHVAISCGENNSYGFPHKAMLDRLEAAGVEWHRTDTEGTLRYISDGQSVYFKE